MVFLITTKVAIFLSLSWTGCRGSEMLRAAQWYRGEELLKQGDDDHPIKNRIVGQQSVGGSKLGTARDRRQLVPTLRRCPRYPCPEIPTRLHRVKLEHAHVRIPDTDVADKQHGPGTDTSIERHGSGSSTASVFSVRSVSLQHTYEVHTYLARTSKSVKTPFTRMVPETAKSPVCPSG